jgi:hypothetical protein
MNNDILIETINHLETSIKELNNLVYYKKELLEKLISYQQKTCQHDWVLDSIDQLNGYSECLNIKYCCKCNYTDKK